MKNEDKQRMHHNASAYIFGNARKLRDNMTEAEKMLWEALRLKRLSGYKFRRQHPIGKFIVDFYCHEVKLVIELDGGYHNGEEQKEYDSFRTKALEDVGLNEIRFTNEQVYNNLDEVLEEIRGYLPPHGPSP